MRLETVWVDVPERALEAFEAALLISCETVGLFRDHTTGGWRVEGVKKVGANEAALAAAFALAVQLSGIDTCLHRMPTHANGWLARSHASFPEQLLGERFSIRGTHLRNPPATVRLVLRLDAGLAFGSGEHGSTQGCMLALEHVAKRRPRRILDLGTGSGILAMAAARLLRRRVLATDIDPWAVRVAQRNAALNGLGTLMRVRLADGWRPAWVRVHGPYDLVLANILARPLCHMARELSLRLAPGGTAILSGLLRSQMRSVLNAHLACGLRLENTFVSGDWLTLVLRRRHRSALGCPRDCEPERRVSRRRSHALAYGPQQSRDQIRGIDQSATARYRTARDPSAATSHA
jgi:ribosomal protein L11 methyltransferase